MSFYEANMSRLATPTFPVGSPLSKLIDAAEPYPLTDRGCEIDGIDVPMTLEDWPGEDLPKAWSFVSLGFMPQLAQLAGRLRPRARVVVIEKDARWLRTVFEKFDLSELLNRDCLTFVMDDDPVKLRIALGSMNDYMNRSCLMLKPFADYDFEWQVARLEDIIEYADIQRTTLITVIGNSAKSGENVVANLPDYLATNTIMPLSNALAGVPAVCVAAGPSLDKQLPLLKELSSEHKALIVSASTCLAPLMCRGITPDFVCALDWSDLGQKFFDLPERGDWRKHETVCVFDSKVGPGVVEAAKSFRHVYTGNPWLSRLIPRTEMPHAIDLPGSTVAHLNVMLAHFMGCSPIMTIGYDMSFTDGKYYADCIHASHPWKAEFREGVKKAIEDNSQALRPVPAADGAGDVFVDAHMQSYLSEFTWMARHMTDRVIDCTEGGALKKDVPAMKFADAIEQHCKVSVAEEIAHAKDCIGWSQSRFDRMAAPLIRRNVLELRGYRESLRKLAKAYSQLTGKWWLDLSLVTRIRSRIASINRQLVAMGNPAALMDAWAQATMVNRRWQLEELEAEKGLTEDQRRLRQFNLDVVSTETLAAGATAMLDALKKCAATLQERIGRCSPVNKI